mgnify:CR=1 FL=1
MASNTAFASKAKESVPSNSATLPFDSTRQVTKFTKFHGCSNEQELSNADLSAFRNGVKVLRISILARNCWFLRIGPEPSGFMNSVKN